MDKTYIEIKDQYRALRKTFDYMASRKEDIVKLYNGFRPRSLTFIGCGSSYCLCQSAEMSAKIKLGIPANAIPAGDLMLHHKSYGGFLEGTMAVVVSRSGSTTEVLRAVESLKAGVSAPVLAISCVTGSDLSRMADLTLELPWAFDESVCQTRTVVNLYAANLLILAYLSGNEKLEQDMEEVIRRGEGYMEKYEEELKKIGCGQWSDVVVLADGEVQGIAAEAALAFIEIAQVPGKSYHLLDARHGPMVLIGPRTLVIACITGEDFKLQKDLIADIKKRGATVVTYSDKALDKTEGVSLAVESGLELDHGLRGIPFIYISQMIAYYRARNRGINPDNPDGIVAWVKL